MIVNQNGGGGTSGGETWKHYRYTSSYAYNSSGSTRNLFNVEGNISQYNMSGYISFYNSSGTALAVGQFATGTQGLLRCDDVIYTNKAAGSGSSAATCGSFEVSTAGDGLRIGIVSSANSYAYGSASRVEVVADVFYQEE